ncbi:MAG: hypothetical protein ABGZ53_21015 [Fuerstiella sp.]
MSQTGPSETATPQSEKNDAGLAPGMAAETGGSDTLVCFIIAGIVATGLSAAAIAHSDDYFQLPEELTSQIGISSELKARFDAGEISGGEVMGMGMSEQDPELQSKINAARRKNHVNNTALSLSLIGLLVAGCLGCGAGFARKSRSLSIIGLLTGIVLGSGLGAVGGLASTWTEDALMGSEKVDQMVRTIAMHAAGWAVIGIAVGLSVGLPNQASRSLKFVGAAVSAGVLSAALFTIGAAVIFSGENADLPVPDGTGNRLLWTGLCAVAMAIMIGLVANNTTNRSVDAS